MKRGSGTYKDKGRGIKMIFDELVSKVEKAKSAHYNGW